MIWILIGLVLTQDWISERIGLFFYLIFCLGLILLMGWFGLILTVFFTMIYWAMEE
jgi:hypothetical protein